MITALSWGRDAMAEDAAKTNFFGLWLAETREGKGLGTRTLATKIGISHATISRLEDGLVGATPDMVKKIAEGLEATLDLAMSKWLQDEMGMPATIRYFSDLEDVEMVDAFSGLPQPLRKVKRADILETARAFRKQNPDTLRVGKRSDTEENPTLADDEDDAA